ncbi:hypothetical protein [Nocardia cyriacigeorgica]|uniref:phage terminase small subunit n=1 Tax=Nocardia cyriacigeorgica TaxID=135487 RepID=UPI0024555B0B|nr:hypothetical protein [Nocardia cyriacigeorgica]
MDGDEQLRSRGRRRASAARKVTPPPVDPRDLPELPQRRPDGGKWPAETLAWWKSWQASEYAGWLSPLDWESLKLGAVCHARSLSGRKGAAGAGTQLTAITGRVTRAAKARQTSGAATSTATDDFDWRYSPDRSVRWRKVNGRGEAETLISAKERRGGLKPVN